MILSSNVWLKGLVAGAVVLAVGGSVWAESMRPLLTKENRLPEKWQFEVGANYKYVDYKDDMPLKNTSVGGPYARFGLFENMALFLDVPFRQNQWRLDDKKESGISDLGIGFELRAWQDALRYPWVLPHFTLTLPSGAEDKYLGYGNAVPTFGVAVGTLVDEQFHWILDGRYSLGVDTDAQSRENVASAAATFMWDLSETFSLIAEAKVTNEKYWIYDDETPFYFNGGMSFKPIESVSIIAYVGSTDKVGEDIFGQLKANFTF